VLRFNLSLTACAAILIGAAVVAIGTPGWAASVSDGTQVARRRCAQCHGPTGMGDGKELRKLDVPVIPVPWPDKQRMAKFTDEQLNQIILLGGKAVGKSRLMPPFRHKLSNSQIADVVAYIRSLAQ
jgi:cytochrome c oxidase cbb3-type subunit 3